MGFGWNIAFMKYGERWKREYVPQPTLPRIEIGLVRRSIFKKTFHQPATSLYKPNIQTGARTLLQLLLLSPEQFPRWIYHAAGVALLSSTHGIDVQIEDDPFMEVARRATHAISIAGAPGAFLVDVLPWLKHVPEWLPGAGFKKFAREASKVVTAAPHLTYDYVKTSMVSAGGAIIDS